MTDRFYSYDPDHGFSEHSTAEAAQTATERVLQELLDRTDARDSLAILTELDQLRARVAELENERDTAHGEVIDLREEACALRGRLAALESPPVVPEGWLVYLGAGGNWSLRSVPITNIDAEPAALRALAWARERNECPPHAGKQPTCG